MPGAMKLDSILSLFKCDLDGADLLYELREGVAEAAVEAAVAAAAEERADVRIGHRRPVVPGQSCKEIGKQGGH